ncbi:MAG: molybdate ABC transporter permease subunit [Alphaproteobacteria bacterium]|nr:molybdate ABC transporter permease subunit [Alphaproteobacteria bacterium]
MILSEFELQALLLSLKVGFWTVVLSLPFALLIAWILARYQFYGKFFLDGLIHLPLIIPPVVIGYSLLTLFGKQGVIGNFLYNWFDITLIFNWKGAVLASAIMAFPLMVRTIRIALETLNFETEIAARTLGATPFDVFCSITLPRLVPAIIAGMILSFARSLGEFGATITFVSNIPGQTQTLPIAIYSLTQKIGGEEAAWRLSIICIIIAFLALFLLEAFKNKIKNLT